MKNTLKILIVEDDFGNALSVETLVHELGYYCLGVIDNSEDALKSIKADNPDLVIMDININGQLDGIEVAKTNNDPQLPIIFITGLDDKDTYSKAKEVLPVAYLIKPFNSLTLQSTIEYAFNAVKAAEPLPAEPEKEWEEDMLLKNNFFIKKNNKLEKVNFTEIHYIQSEGNYSILQTKEKKYVVKISLNKIIDKFPDSLFIRVHQRYIIQTDLIKNIDSQCNNVNIEGVDIPIGRSYKNDLLSRINKL